MPAPDLINDFRGPDYGFLSNFFPCEVGFEGRVYPSSEHAFQAAKTFNEEERARISTLRWASEAKKAGRSVTLRADWEVVKVVVMSDILMDKFTRNRSLGGRLLATGDALLVEGNAWHDHFWGECDGRGTNVLGALLMITRDRLRAA